MHHLQFRWLMCLIMVNEALSPSTLQADAGWELVSVACTVESEPPLHAARSSRPCVFSASIGLMHVGSNLSAALSNLPISMILESSMWSCSIPLPL